MIQVETERLEIRNLTMDDVDAVHRIIDVEMKFDDLNREERARWVQWLVLSYEQHDRLYQPSYGERAIVLKATGEVIGLIGIVPNNAPFGLLPYFRDKVDAKSQFFAEVGLYWAVAIAHQRKGYATEATRGLSDHLFREWKLKRVLAWTDDDNEASQTVMRKLGMVMERNPYPDPFWLQVVGILENPAVDALP